MSESVSDVVPRSARWFVGVLLAALTIPGVIGFDVWPLTGWRLFSLARSDSQTRWVMDAVDSDGSIRRVSLEELPLAYRNAEWQTADLPQTSRGGRDQVCRDLLDAVVDVYPATTELRISRDRQRLVEDQGDWTTTHDPEVFQTCRT